MLCIVIKKKKTLSHRFDALSGNKRITAKNDNDKPMPIRKNGQPASVSISTKEVNVAASIKTHTTPNIVIKVRSAIMHYFFRYNSNKKLRLFYHY